MAKKSRANPNLSITAQGDIRKILRWSKDKFGRDAGVRYRDLLMQTLRDIAEDPERPGSQERPEMMVKGARTYHLSFSRTRVSGERVKDPRHFVLYRYRRGMVEVGRILHDSRDLARHLPQGYDLRKSDE